MKRTQEKIKDFVEPQDFDDVRGDVAADPARALAAYRFTDFTSDLLARWLDALADLPRGRGTARALAGARGVGKSHTLAVFCALAGSERLRATVADTHVATSARRLLERRYTVVRVERGTRATLAEEMAAAFTKVFGGNEVQWGGEPAQMLAVAASRANESTLIVCIDTAFNRPARVQRDDGPQLSALTTVSAGINAFVALALDDDISGADGANVALSGTYQIDYVDTEHLYRVVEQYLLRKSPQARDLLHEVYLSLRSTVPGFNWSEPRFASLYPVHPLVADVSSAVRLYAPAFAFLPFAAQAAARAMGRPALSLILLDEVFDVVESDLRKSVELSDAFDAYDHLTTKGLEKIPLMGRLHAKLILKSLFILSLDGSGATAGELCAALLMSDESLSQPATEYVGDILARFMEAALPHSLRQNVKGEGAGESRYRLQIDASASLDDALDEHVSQTPADEWRILQQLRSIPRTLFADWALVDSVDGQTATPVSFHLPWRGSERPGRIVWRSWETDASTPASDDGNSTGDNATERQGGAAQYVDWEVLMLPPTASDVDGAAGQSSPADEVDAVAVRIVWQPATLTAEEVLTLRRLHALRTDAALASKFGETVQAALGTLAAQSARIWTRIYLNDSALFINGERESLTNKARAARTLGASLAETLAPHFDKLYTQHPRFTETLGEREVTYLTEKLFDVADTSDAETQRLCRAFVLPLGLATTERSGGACTFDAGDEPLAHLWNREAVALVEESAGQSTSLERVRVLLRSAPYGFTRETQNLVIAALVAGRRIELITESGERINRRGAVHAIDWRAVASVCRAEVARYSPEKLTLWARLLTGESELPAGGGAVGRGLAREALACWLGAWQARRFVETFDALSGNNLTTRLWKMNVKVRKSFGASADAVSAALNGKIALEEALERVCDAFGGSVENFALAAWQLNELTALIEGSAGREQRRAYLATAEPTGVAEIESARRELLNIARDPHSLLEEDSRARFDELWQTFQARFVERYASIHDKTVGAGRDGEWLVTLRRTERWRQFEALSQLSVVSNNFSERAEELLRQDADARCDLPVRELLSERPACGCAFRLTRAFELESLPQDLETLVTHALGVYRRTLKMLSGHLAIGLDALARKETDTETARRARSLSNAFAQQSVPENLARPDVQLIERALQRMAAPPPVRVASPVSDHALLTRGELRARLTQWLDELPEEPVLIEVFAGGASGESP